ncbi:MAG: hypothetical protein ABW215_11555 [Kibdelosporangium sp.]
MSDTMTSRARQYARRCREHFDELVPSGQAPPPADATETVEVDEPATAAPVTDP